MSTPGPVRRIAPQLPVIPTLAADPLPVLLWCNLPPEAPPMSDSFLSSDEYDENAHSLYNEGRYDEALDLLRVGVTLYPHAVELHVGMAYAYLAREEYAWARRSFERAIAQDPDHEDALAGLGESLLKIGDRGGALRRLRARRRARLPRRPRTHAAARPRPLPRGAPGAGPPLLRVRGVGPSRLAGGRRLRRLRLAPARQRQRRALLAPPRPRDRPDLRRGARLPRQPAVRPRRVRGRAPPPRAHRSRRSISTSSPSGATSS